MSVRACSNCQLCCKLVPVGSLSKRASQRCRHQRHGKGCGIYARRPTECALWSCAWLTRDVHDGIGRPDRVHYVIDPDHDTVRVAALGTAPDEAGWINLEVVQVWCDPAHPDAWQDPALRTQIEHWSRADGLATLIRWGNARAMAIMPPEVSPTGEWTLSEDAPPGLNGVGRYSQTPPHLRVPL